VFSISKLSSLLMNKTPAIGLKLLSIKQGAAEAKIPSSKS